MSHSTLDAEFLTDLTPEQRGHLWEYYRLTTGSLNDSEKELDRLAAIWSDAEHDLVLSKWLCLIDYFYTDVPFSYEEEDDNRRAYWSEYIELLVNEKQACSEADSTARIDADAFCAGSHGQCTLICPDGSGFVLKSTEEINSMNEDDLRSVSCDRCHQQYIDHRISCTETPSVG